MRLIPNNAPLGRYTLMPVPPHRQFLGVCPRWAWVQGQELSAGGSVTRWQEPWDALPLSLAGRTLTLAAISPSSSPQGLHHNPVGLKLRVAANGEAAQLLLGIQEADYSSVSYPWGRAGTPTSYLLQHLGNLQWSEPKQGAVMRWNRSTGGNRGTLHLALFTNGGVLTESWDVEHGGRSVRTPYGLYTLLSISAK